MFRNFLLAGYYTLFKVQGCVNTRAAQRIRYVQSGWFTNMPVLHVLYSRYKNKMNAVVKIRLLLLMIYTESEGKEHKKYIELLSKLYLSTLL